MELNELTAISPVDGRYRRKTALLAPYFSEFGLIRYRVQVEIEYIIALAELPLPQFETFPREAFKALRNVYEQFSFADANAIKEIERTTNHDVKAVEYFVKEKIDTLQLSTWREFVHFGLTSQDVNNTAVPLSLKEAVYNVVAPSLQSLINKINELSQQWRGIPMLAHTHGQPASPTTLGKEFRVFAERLENQTNLLTTVPFSAKFGGATGNFNAHHAAYPQVNWIQFGNNFVNNALGLQRLQTTTQIEHYDMIAAFCDNYKRINNILIDFARDVWTYISMNYFKQTIKKGEVGSSAMPHKVNPIDFENAEGNLGVANALFEHLAAKLPISRLQRDLTDSTVLRNIGVPLAHTMLAYQSLLAGLNKITLNESALQDDLEDNWAVVAEGIQTILRREAYPNPYEALKELTRTNQKINAQTMQHFIANLDVKPSVKEELMKLTPFSYTGIIQ